MHDQSPLGILSIVINYLENYGNNDVLNLGPKTN